MNYNLPIEFEWDDAKSDACFQQRGFDFAYAAQAFFDPNRMVQADTRHNYSEDRFQTMGKIDGRLFIVVYTPRNHITRIVSARKANHREVRHYENHTNDN